MTLPRSLLEALQPIVGTPERVQALSGGSINDVRLVHGTKRKAVVKLGRGPRARAMFAAEAAGLEALAAAGALRVPEVWHLHNEPPALVLAYIPPGQPDRRSWAAFGESLALLHRSRAEAFGFPHDNFIGSLPQTNTLTRQGPEFYRRYRLEAQLGMPGCQRLLDRNDRRAFERLFQRLPELLPDEPPALIHGDLWSGNFLWDASGQAALIDPAACWCYREMDIAMAQLFGGFDAVFFEAYAATWPHQPGLPERIDLFQLYYLLVHVNLFGGSYVGSVRRILQRLA